MKKRISGLLAIVLSIMILGTIAALPATAASSQGDITTGTISIDKFLVL